MLSEYLISNKQQYLLEQVHGQSHPLSHLSSAAPSSAASPVRIAATREPPCVQLLIIDLNGTWQDDGMRATG